MQVNVKELTGVLHLNLVFMIVLVLQSFLAVFLKCHKYSASVIGALSPECNSHPKLLRVCSVQHFQAPSAFFTPGVLSVTPPSNCLF